MARVTITNTHASSYLIPSPVRSIIGPYRSRVFDGISISEMESSASFVKAVESGAIIVAITEDPGVPDEIEAGNQISDSHLDTRRMLAPLDLYVDGTNGDDSLSGTETAPLRTLQAAYDAIPEVVTQTVTIHLIPFTGDYVIPTCYKQLRANMWVVGEGVTELLGSTATDGTSEAVVTTTGMTLNEYQGKTVEILTGAAAGDRRTIRDNTTTSINSVFPFSETVTAGDTFRVFEPLVTVKNEAEVPGELDGITLAVGTGGNFTAIVSSNSGLSFENLIWEVDKRFNSSGSSCFFYGVEFSGTTLLYGDGSWFFGADRRASSGTWFQSSWRLDRGTPHDKSWTGWGCLFDGFLFSDRGSLQFLGVILGALIITSGEVNVGGGFLAAISTVEGSPNAGCNFDVNPHSSTRVLIEKDDADTCKIWGSNHFCRIVATDIVRTTAGPAMNIAQGATVHIDGVNVTSDAVGISITRGGVVEIDTGVVITATGNDIEVGNTPTVTNLAAIPTAGDFVAESPSDGSVLRKI